MRGRKPKPTHLKAITGNPGKRPLNTAEPLPPLEIPACPQELNARAKAEWNRLAELLGDLHLLTPLDRAALAAYCAAYARWAEAQEHVETYGALVKSPTGFPMQSPWLTIANRQGELMLGIASEFGFTPASRARIVARKDEQGELFGKE